MANCDGGHGRQAQRFRDRERLTALHAPAVCLSSPAYVCGIRSVTHVCLDNQTLGPICQPVCQSVLVLQGNSALGSSGGILIQVILFVTLETRGAKGIILIFLCLAPTIMYLDSTSSSSGP